MGHKKFNIVFFVINVITFTEFHSIFQRTLLYPKIGY